MRRRYPNAAGHFRLAAAEPAAAGQAVDPHNKLAVKQSQLVVGMLSLMARQLPVQFKFDCDELERLLASAKRMRELPAGDGKVKAALERLAERGQMAADVLERVKLDPAEVLAAIRALREAMGAIVCMLGATADTAAQLKVERIVLDLSKEQLLRDRAMLVMQGFERDPAALPSLESLFGLQAA